MEFSWSQLAGGLVILYLIARRFMGSKNKTAAPRPEKKMPGPAGALLGRVQDWSQAAGGGSGPGEPPQAMPPPEPAAKWSGAYDQGGPHLAPPYEEGTGRGTWLLWVAPILILLSLTYYYYQHEVDALIRELIHFAD